MGLLRFLFGGKRGQASIEKGRNFNKQNPDISFIGTLIRIKSIDFTGLYSRSNSGEWIVGWSDSDKHGNVGGYRESGYGSFVFYNLFQNRICARGKLERPNNGIAADNGVFLLEDWHFGSDLRGTIYIFSQQGKVIISKQFGANILNSALSNGGTLAICQTAANSFGNDGNLLTAFNVETKSELFSIHPQTGWADKYEFLEEEQVFIVVKRDIGKFRYDRFGNFLDTEYYEMASLKSKKYDVALLAADELLKKQSLERKQIELILEEILRARVSGADKDQGWKTMALKLQGMALEALGRDCEALTAYDAALRANPRIGVKRKADALRKKCHK